MITNSMWGVLIGELYETMGQNRPMNFRRIKRLLSIDEFNTETANRAAGCHANSCEMRRIARKARIPLHLAIFDLTEDRRGFLVRKRT